jgi:hypothetical protein
MQTWPSKKSFLYLHIRVQGFPRSCSLLSLPALPLSLLLWPSTTSLPLGPLMRERKPRLGIWFAARSSFLLIEVSSCMLDRDAAQGASCFRCGRRHGRAVTSASVHGNQQTHTRSRNTPHFGENSLHLPFLPFLILLRFHLQRPCVVCSPHSRHSALPAAVVTLGINFGTIPTPAFKKLTCAS